jgi:flagellar basal-body rod protein FlgB
VGLFDITQIALERALSGAEQRQKLLANNLANANTPGFKRSDLDFHSALASALDSGEPAAATFTPQTDTTSSMTADGNNVDTDAEMSHLTENSLDYQSLVDVANARLKMISTAIGNGQ